MLTLVLSLPGSALAESGTTGPEAPAGSDANSSARQDFGHPHPDAAPELAEFAFLIGEWKCELDFIGGDWKTRYQSRATWTVYYIQDGRAIMDDFRGGFGDNYLATTIRVFDRQQKAWRGYWIAGQSGQWSRPLHGEKTAEGMRLLTSTAVRSPQGEVVEVDLQYEFHDIGADEFRWSQHSSLDGGETWRRETIRMHCRRSAGPS